MICQKLQYVVNTDTLEVSVCQKSNNCDMLEIPMSEIPLSQNSDNFSMQEI